MLSSIACGKPAVDFKSFPDPKIDIPGGGAELRKIVLAGGCFWCTEGVFEQIPGVIDVVSGYAGGTAETANYERVSSGDTAHAEVIEVTYDPNQVTFGRLLKFFFAVAHDPTTLNRQGPDTGTQYRSAIFYLTEEEKRVAEAYIKQLDDAGIFAAPIVTKVEKLAAFYPAEDYHQDFVRNNPKQGYVVQQALPKIAKAKKAVAEESATTQPK